MNHVIDQLDWSPVKRGGVIFRTHRLVVFGENTLAFRPTVRAYAVYSSLSIAGAAAFALGCGLFLWTGFGLIALVLTLAGPPLFVMGLVLLVRRSGSIRFDRQRGYCWRGRKDPERVWDKGGLKDFAELKDAVCLQVVDELVAAGEQSFVTFELNLVLKDGTRINLVDHGDEVSFFEDAERLADFLKLTLAERPSVSKDMHRVGPRPHPQSPAEPYPDASLDEP